MAVIREYMPPRAKRPRVIGTFPMPDGSRRSFKGHSVAEVTRKWESARDAMQVKLQRKEAMRLYKREYARLRREALAANGICQCCGREDAMPGRTTCWPCALYKNQHRYRACSVPPSPHYDGRRLR